MRRGFFLSFFMSSIVFSLISVHHTRAFTQQVSRSLKSGIKVPGTAAFRAKKGPLRDRDGFLLNSVSEGGSSRKSKSKPSYSNKASLSEPVKEKLSHVGSQSLKARLAKAKTKSKSTDGSEVASVAEAEAPALNVPRRFLMIDPTTKESLVKPKPESNPVTKPLKPTTTKSEARSSSRANSLENAVSKKHATVSRVSADFASSKVVSEITSGDRPFTLPTGAFKPKQSLGQNFLSDQNYVLKIVNALTDDSEQGSRVVELGPGPGALSRMLIQRYPNMTAVEIDQRAVAFLQEKLPTLRVLHMDVLKCDWAKMAEERGTYVLSIINKTCSLVYNSPYNLQAVDYQ